MSLDKETGLTVPPEDAESLFRAILWMKDHPEERKEMGIRARRRVKEKFSQEQMLGQILELYKELCGQ